MHNITELIEGRNHTHVGVMYEGRNFNQATNTQTASAMNTSNTGGMAAAAAATANNSGINSLNRSGNQNNLSRDGGKPKIIVDFNFSHTNNNHIVIAMTDDVDSKVVVFDWNSARVIACSEWKRQIIDRVTFNPSEETREVCVSGHGIWGLYAIKDGSKDGILNTTNKNFCEMVNKARRHIPFAANTKTIFTEHCWLDKNRLLGCT